MSAFAYIEDSVFLWGFSFDIDGKQYSRRGFSSRQEAMLAEASLVVSVLGPSSSLSFGQAVISYSGWLRDQVKRSSFEKFLSRKRLYLDSLPASVLWADMSYSVLSSWWDSLSCSSGVRYRLLLDLKGLSEWSRVYLGVENLEWKKLRIPKDYSVRRLPKKGYVLSFDDFGRLLSFEKDSFWRLLFLLSFVGALRVGEVRGLCPSCFDFSEGTMEVFRQVVNLKGGQAVTSPKTERSVRLVWLPSSLCSAVSSFVSERSIAPDDFLFSLRKGKAVGGTSIDRRLHSLQKEAGLPEFRFHCFRRSEASLLNECGLPGEVVSSYLGHSSFGTTKRFYLGDSDERKAMLLSVLEGRVDKLLAGK